MEELKKFHVLACITAPDTLSGLSRLDMTQGKIERIRRRPQVQSCHHVIRTLFVRQWLQNCGGTPMNPTDATDVQVS